MTRGLLLLLLASSALARQATPSPAAAAFAISGVVVDSVGATPLPRTEVAIAPVNRRMNLRMVITDGAGRFNFQNLAQGKYSLTAARPGYPAQGFNQHEGFATAIAVGPGLDATQVVFRLHPAAVIFGRVTDSGDPVPNTMVTLYREGIMNGHRTTWIRAGGGTDDQGNYRFRDLEPGRYRVMVSGRPWYARFGGPNNHISQSVSALLDLAYPVTVYPGATSPDGASVIQLHAGAQVEADVVLTAVRAASLTVAPPGAGDTAFEVRVFMPTSWGPVSVNTNINIAVNGKSQVITGMAPGRYRVEAEWTDGEKQRHAFRRTLDVSGDTSLDLATGGDPLTVDGLLNWPGGPSPAAGADIILRSVDSTAVVAALADATGTVHFDAANLDAGRWEVGLARPRGYYIQRINAKGAGVDGRTIDLPASGSVTIGIAVGYGVGTVDGVVRAGGKTVAGAMVLLLPEDLSNASELLRRDQTDSDGTFTLDAIVPGRYTLVAIDGADPLEYDNAEAMRPYVERGKPMIIEGGGRYNETLEPLLRDAGGSPAPARPAKTEP